MLREADSSPAGWLPQTVLQMTKGRQFPWRPAHSVVHWTWVWSPLRCSPQQTTSEEPGLSLFTDILGRYHTAAWLFARHRPHFFFIYLPHLDYAAQRSGPDSDEAIAAL